MVTQNPADTSGDGQPRTLDEKTLSFLDGIARQIHAAIGRGELPAIEILVRSLSNVSYDAECGYLKLGDLHKLRTLTVNTVHSFAQTLRLMATSRSMVRSDDFATKREAYYVSKNWGECRFDNQAESDAIMDDIEVLASLQGLSREQLRFCAESHGGSVAGELVVIDSRPESAATIEVDCRRLGSGSYSIPRSAEQLSFRTTADFVLAIETGGMFQRLNKHQFWKTANCILVEMGAFPLAPRVALFAGWRTIPIYRFTASSIATRMASRISIGRSRPDPATQHTSTSFTACHEPDISV